MIDPATGSIFVEMKKNSASFQPFTGWMESANAAGSANASTMSVDTTVMLTEWAR